MSSQSNPNDLCHLCCLDTAQTKTDPLAFQATWASGGVVSRLLVEIDEVNTRVSKEIWPPSIDSIELSVSAASICTSLMELSGPESCKLIKMRFNFDAIEVENSLYSKVCASISNINDPEMPALAFRMWVIGLVLCIIRSGLSIFFNFHQLATQVRSFSLYLHSYHTSSEKLWCIYYRWWCFNHGCSFPS